MPAPKLIRCGKCHVVMGVRHYVLVHRRPRGMDCPAVSCVVCKRDVGHEGLASDGLPVCSEFCQRNHRVGMPYGKAVRDIHGEFAAMRRAEKLPPVYQRLDKRKEIHRVRESA